MAPARSGLRRFLREVADHLSPYQPPLITQLSLGHFLHQLFEIGGREIGTDSAQTLRYLFANLFLTEGVEFCKRGICVDLFW